MVPVHLACRNLASVHPTCILAAEITQGVSQLGIPATAAALLASQQLPGRAERSHEDGAPADSQILFSSGWGLLFLCCGSPARLSQGSTSGTQRGGVSGLGAKEEQIWCFCSGCVLYRSKPSDCCVFTKGVGAGWEQQTTNNCGLKQKHLWNHAKFVYIF